MTDKTDTAALLVNLKFYAGEASCHPDTNYYLEFEKLCTPANILAVVDQLEAERQRAAGSEEELHKAFHREKPAERKLLAAQEEIAALKTDIESYISINSELATEVEELRAKLADVLVMPDGLHKDTKALVLVFASAMAVKLHKAQQKYGYDNSWMDSDWKDKCQHDLLAHVTKGDPLDVAAYCAFMWHHGWPTAPMTTVKGEL